jgi:epoxyqueuosine reductase
VPDVKQQDALWIKEQALALGFTLAGIAPTAPSARADYIRAWIASGQAGTMQWLNRHLDAKCDVHAYMPEAKSVICVAANYHFPLPESAPAEPSAQIARYALGDDYHEIFKPRLHKLADLLRQRFPDAQTRCCVDSSPVLEREFAAAAGIGWIGKNTCILHPRIGSWLLLGEVLTSLDLPADQPSADHCGTCTRCIDACPTHAITGPYQMDPRKCISYLTIEHRGPLSPVLQAFRWVLLFVW